MNPPISSEEFFERFQKALGYEVARVLEDKTRPLTAYCNGVELTSTANDYDINAFIKQLQVYFQTQAKIVVANVNLNMDAPDVYTYTIQTLVEVEA